MTDEQRARFDGLFEEVLEALPPGIADLLEEIPVVVDDRPSDTLLKELAAEYGESEPMEADQMCGLHTGVPLTEMSVESTGVLPPEIRIFREGIIRLAGGWREDGVEDDIYDEIAITLLHEIGHHFGLDEDDLARLGYD